MNFWLPFMREMDREEELARKAEEQHKTKPEVELEEIEEEINRIMIDKMPSASSVKRYNSLIERRNKIETEIDYSKWFNENKLSIEKMFKILFNYLTISDSSYMIVDYDKKNNELCFNEEIKLNYKYAGIILKRYGYIILDMRDTKKRISY